MGVNLSIKGVADKVAERLRLRAERNHRSLQGELMAIIEQAANMQEAGQHLPQLPQLPHQPQLHLAEAGSRSGDRAWTQGHKTIEQLMSEREATGWKPHPTLARAPLAADIVRADRDAR